MDARNPVPQVNCFALSLLNTIKQEEEAERFRLAKRIGLQVVLPLAGAILISLWAAPSINPAEVDGFFADVVKLFSLFVIALHTFGAADDIRDRGVPTKIYRLISVYLLLIAMLLAAHALALYLVDKQTGLDGLTKLTQNQQLAHKIIYGRYTELTIAFLSCFYLILFFFANRQICKNNQQNLGISRFTQAFIYGANLPFIAASFVIMMVFLIPKISDVLGDHPDSFLIGSITFLVFGSVAANICIDIYARPFLKVHSVACQHNDEIR